ncbi:hypothetical protein [Citrobacter freundii]|uniref:hypothetical protein n=1 Tax=Citrobacter freundii TaxID=546 RepID=UPI000AFAE9A8|nr:hypothetical protein [Citrobacter freundii]
MNDVVYDPVRIMDIPCKKYPQVIAGIEQIRMLKGGTFSYRWLPPMIYGGRYS